MSEGKFREGKCKGDVTSSGDRWARSYPCQNKAKFGDYCGIHCPEKRAAKQAARLAEYDREWDEKEERERLRTQHGKAEETVMREAQGIIDRASPGEFMSLRDALDNLAKIKVEMRENGI